MYDSLAKVYALLRDAVEGPEAGRVRVRPDLAEAEARGEAGAVLEVRLPRAELLPVRRRTRSSSPRWCKPYLANKKDKTFLDHWLLGDDLSEYLEPWEYGRLNTVERVLLAQRIAGEPDEDGPAPRTTCSRLLPPNIDRQTVPVRHGRRWPAAWTATTRSATGSKQLGSKSCEVRARTRRQATTADASGRRPAEAAAAPAADAGAGLRGAGGGPRGDEAGRPRRRRDGAAKQVTAKDGEARPAEAASRREADAEDASSSTTTPRSGSAVRQLFRKLDPTQEWAENNYYQLPHRSSRSPTSCRRPVLARLRPARRQGAVPVAAPRRASRNFTEMMFALAVLDLPFEAGKHDVAVRRRQDDAHARPAR